MSEPVSQPQPQPQPQPQSQSQSPRTQSRATRPRGPARLALAALLAIITGVGSGVARAEGAAKPLFEEVGETAGLDFRHFNGRTGGLYLVEVTGSGLGLLDFDGDGDLDLYLVQGGIPNPEESLEDALVSPADGSLPLTDRLYRNDAWADADGALRLAFVDRTEASAIDAPHYGMGVAAGDYDGDGDTDLYVTNFGPNQLLRNNGDGTFSDVTETSGAGDIRWSVSAAFADFDRDGHLDLYVGNYVDQRFTSGSSCTNATGAPDYCGPLAFRPFPDRLLRNRGDGTFEDGTPASGALEEFGGALGVVATDFNGDDWIDLYVANDMTANQLRINQRDGSFLNDAVFAGAAVNWEGKPEASMGVDAGDFDGDGDEDLFMAHLTGETNTLYVNDGTGVFDDATVTSGLGSTSWVATGFGTGWIDFDRDGRLDLFVANGAVRAIEELVEAGDPFPLHQPNQIFRNLRDGRFEEVSGTAPAFAVSEVSRGSAFGDVDNDGDEDIAVSNNDGPVRLLLGAPPANPWLGISSRDGGTGWKARAETASGETLWRRSRRDGSYASARDPRVFLGASTPIESVTLTRPGARSIRLSGVPSARVLVWADLAAP